MQLVSSMLRFATLLKISCCTPNIVITIDTIKELGKDVLLSCHEHGTDKNILKSLEESNLKPLDSPLSCRESTESKAHKQVQI